MHKFFFPFRHDHILKKDPVFPLDVVQVLWGLSSLFHVGWWGPLMELVFPLESPSVAFPFRNLHYQEILARGGEWLADRNWNFLPGPHPTISQLLQTGGSVLYHLSNLPLPCPPGHQPHLAVSLLYCTTGRKFTTSLGARNGTGFTFTDGGSQPKEP